MTIPAPGCTQCVRLALQMEEAAQRADRLEEELKKQTFLLTERVKELECLHAISRLFDRRDEEPEEVLQAIIKIIPQAWAYPEVAEACLFFRDICFQTPGFRETEWQLTSPITVNDETAGRITVSYLDERPVSDEGPFLPEERTLLNNIAKRLGWYIERRWSLRSLLSYQEDLRCLASALSLSEQRERRRIAEGLHDRIGQNLALLSIRLSAAEQAAIEKEPLRMIAEARKLVSEVIAETRSLTFELCPPILYELGLGAALDWLAEQFEDSFGVRVIVRVHGDSGALAEDARAILFAATREVLTNACRHAHATTVNVDVFNSREQVRVTVEDDGVGFDPRRFTDHVEPHEGFGLFNIRERLQFMGGALDISSQTGRGTNVGMTLPRVPETRSRERQNP